MGNTWACKACVDTWDLESGVCIAAKLEDAAAVTGESNQVPKLVMNLCLSIGGVGLLFLLAFFLFKRKQEASLKDTMKDPVVVSAETGATTLDLETKAGTPNKDKNEKPSSSV